MVRVSKTLNNSDARNTQLVSLIIHITLVLMMSNLGFSLRKNMMGDVGAIRTLNCRS